MRRREFITLFGGVTTAWPLVAQAQRPALPVIGYISGRSSDEAQYVVAAFEKGLREGGFVEGQNVAIEFRWAENEYERLPALAADLVSRRVVLIAASGAVQAIQAAKTATSTIPIVFVTGDDPVRLGFVASLNRPAGNLTGVTALFQSMETKRLDILNQLLPRTTVIAVLVNDSNPSATLQVKETVGAARTLGRELDILNISSASEFDDAFSTLKQKGDGAVTFIADPFFNSHRDQLIALAARHKLPSLFTTREQAVAGGLMSYGASIADAYRQAGSYSARILKGEKPSELPILQPTKFEFIINLKTARAIGLDIPQTLLALADETIE